GNASPAALLHIGAKAAGFRLGEAGGGYPPVVPAIDHRARDLHRMVANAGIALAEYADCAAGAIFRSEGTQLHEMLAGARLRGHDRLLARLDADTLRNRLHGWRGYEAHAVRDHRGRGRASGSGNRVRRHGGLEILRLAPDRRFIAGKLDRL